VSVFRNNEMRRKFLVQMRGIDVLLQLIQSAESPLFRCAVLALSHQATSLQLTASSSAWLDSDLTAGRSRTADDAEDYADLVFVLDDGSQVAACRRVMSRSSDVFDAMLRGGFRESTERRVRIPDAASDAFQTMVTWLHGGPATNGGRAPALDELCELLRLYHRFQMPDALLRRTLLAPLVAAAFDGDEFEGGNFARVYRLLSVYDDAGVLRRDFVVSVFTRQMSLLRRCAAVAGVMSQQSQCDVEEFVSIVAAAFLDAID